MLSDQLRFAHIATKIATKLGADRSVSIGSMTTRGQAAENALASVRAEGLDPGVAEALLRRCVKDHGNSPGVIMGIPHLAGGR
jgi:hypothetical protein